jgi:hypothetical protein
MDPEEKMVSLASPAKKDYLGFLESRVMPNFIKLISKKNRLFALASDL